MILNGGTGSHHGRTEWPNLSRVKRLMRCDHEHKWLFSRHVAQITGWKVTELLVRKKAIGLESRTPGNASTSRRLSLCYRSVCAIVHFGSFPQCDASGRFLRRWAGALDHIFMALQFWGCHNQITLKRLLSRLASRLPRLVDRMPKVI